MAVLFLKSGIKTSEQRQWCLLGTYLSARLSCFVILAIRSINIEVVWETNVAWISAPFWQMEVTLKIRLFDFFWINETLVVNHIFCYKLVIQMYTVDLYSIWWKYHHLGTGVQIYSSYFWVGEPPPPAPSEKKKFLSTWGRLPSFQRTCSHWTTYKDRP